MRDFIGFSFHNLTPLDLIALAGLEVSAAHGGSPGLFLWALAIIFPIKIVINWFVFFPPFAGTPT